MVEGTDKSRGGYRPRAFEQSSLTARSLKEKTRTPKGGIAVLGGLYVIAVVVAVASTAVMYSLWFRHHIAATLDEQTDIARSVAALTTEWLDEPVAAAVAASRSDAAKQLDPAGLRLVLAELSIDTPRIKAASVVDTAGKLVVAAGDIRADAVPAGIVGPAIERLVQASPDTRSNIGVPSAIIAIPIRNDAGLVTGTLTTQVELSGLQALIRTLPVGAGPQVSVFDRDGYVLANKNFGAPTDAQRASVRGHVFLPDVLAGREVRNAEYTGALFGQRRIGVGVPVPGYGWAVLVSEPRSSTDAALMRSLWFTVALITLGIVAGGVGLAWYRWRVVGPLHRLRLAFGDAEVIRNPGPPTGPSEVAELEAAAHAAYLGNLARARDLDHARAQESVARTLSDTLVANATVGLALVGWPDGRIITVNAAFSKQVGITPGRPLWDYVDGGSEGAVALLLRTAADGNRQHSAIIRDGAIVGRWTAIPTSTVPEGGTLVLQLEVSPDHQ